MYELIQTAVDAVNASQPLARKRMARDLRRIAREIAGHRRPYQLHKRRLFYRDAQTFTDADIDLIVAEVGVTRLWTAIDRATTPAPVLEAAE